MKRTANQALNSNSKRQRNDKPVVTENYVIRFATSEMNVLEVFAIHTYKEIIETGNLYLQTWVQFGKKDHSNKTVTVITDFGSEFVNILLKTEILGSLPDSDYGFDESGWNHLFGLAAMIECDTFFSRLDFIETTNLFNAKKVLVTFTGFYNFDLPVPECYIEHLNMQETYRLPGIDNYLPTSRHDFRFALRSVLKSQFHRQNLIGNIFPDDGVFHRAISLLLSTCHTMGFVNATLSLRDYLVGKIVLTTCNFNIFLKSADIMDESPEAILNWLDKGCICDSDGYIRPASDWINPKEMPQNHLNVALPLRFVKLVNLESPLWKDLQKWAYDGYITKSRSIYVHVVCTAISRKTYYTQYYNEIGISVPTSIACNYFDFEDELTRKFRNLQRFIR
jgi:hypothetical protein